MQSVLLIIICLAARATVAAEKLYKALIYSDTTNNITCDCADDLGSMIVNTPGLNAYYNITGPDGETFSAELLQTADIFAFPGGPSLSDAWDSIEPHATAIRDWVADGGLYIGICLGAYLASSGADFAPDTGLNLLPNNTMTAEETTQPGAQITDPNENTVIDVNWTWGSGPNAAQTVDNRTLFFQDGNAILVSDPATVMVLARYSSNGDIAATVSPYGKGWVGIAGVHVDANKSWYTDANFTNPQGIDPNYGYDLVATTVNGVQDFTANRSRPCNLTTTAASSRLTQVSAGIQTTVSRKLLHGSLALYSLLIAKFCCV